jgi:hypothetical protein
LPICTSVVDFEQLDTYSAHECGAVLDASAILKLVHEVRPNPRATPRCRAMHPGRVEDRRRLEADGYEYRGSISQSPAGCHTCLAREGGLSLT